MNRLFSAVVSLALGLWLGGVVMLLLAVSSLFHTFVDQPTTAQSLIPYGVMLEGAAEHAPLKRVLAGTAASGVFHRFELYQLALAAVALTATLAWRIVGPPRFKTALFCLLGLATVAAVTNTAVITPRIEGMRVEALRRGADVSKRPGFGRLHGISMAVYAAESAVLLIAGLVLPAAIRADAGAARQRGPSSNPVATAR